MSDDKRTDAEKWAERGAQAAREAASAVGSAGRRFARGLRDMTRRPDSDADEGAADGQAADDTELGDKVRELGRDFVDLMGTVTTKTGKSLRKAAYDGIDTVRGVVEATRAQRDGIVNTPDDDPDRKGDR